MTDPHRPTPPVVPGAVHRVEIASLDDHGRGTASLGRRTLRVPNARPGELLDVRLEHVGRHLAVGRIMRVAVAAKDRVEDTCRHGMECPGCGLRTTAPAARRAWKRDLVVEALAAAGLHDVEVAATHAAPTDDRWRAKAYLPARKTSRGVFLGLYAEGTHRLVNVEGCPAHAPAVEAVLGAVRRAIAHAPVTVYDERSQQGWLRAVAVRASSVSGRALVTLVATAPPDDAARALAAAIRAAASSVAGVGVNVHPAVSNAPFGGEFLPIEGETSLVEGTADLPLRVSAGSFFQVNPAVGTAIHDAVAEAAAGAPPGPALDLYGGVGATAVRLARAGRPVRLVEAPGPAIEDARANLAAYPGAQVEAARVEDALATALAAGPAVVAVNPPRSGLSATVLSALASALPPRIVYVSCSPTTLARDLAALRAAGGRVTSVVPFDLMPQTPHVEALAVMDRTP